MNWGEEAMWAITTAVLVLTMVLYIRVDWRDWGMAGFTVMLLGGSVLLVRWVLAFYGWNETASDLTLLWRSLALVGAPFAVAGDIAGFWRDPPPYRQVRRRLATLAVVIVAVTAIVAVW